MKENSYIERVLAGEQNAFRYFVREYQQMAYALAYRILQHPEEAEEVVQDAFLSAYKNLHQFKQKSKFSTWLYPIVVRKALARSQKQAKRPLIIETIPEGHNNGDPEAIRLLERAEQKELVQRVLRSMKAKERLVLHLFYLDELSMKEIEGMTGLSLSNIKVLLHRARKHFYHQLSKQQKKSLSYE